MVLNEKKMKKIVKEGVQRLIMESSLASSIANNEKVMDALAREYASEARSMVYNHRRGDFVKKDDSQIKKELIYFLEQNCGVCMTPSAIASALSSIWDKIQLGARKYGYNGPIMAPKSNEPSPRIVEKANQLLANEKFMESLGASCYHASQRTGYVKGYMMSKDYFGSYPNMLVHYPNETGIGYVSFSEAKEIIRYIMKDIKKYAKKYAAQQEEEDKNKESEVGELSEAVYKDVMKKLKRLNG